MFLKGLLFGAGATMGMVAVTAFFIGLIALAEWLNICYESVREVCPHAKLVDRAERAIARRDRLHLLLRNQEGGEESMRSPSPKTTYVQ